MTCSSCLGNVTAGKHCYACGLKGPAGEGVRAERLNIAAKAIAEYGPFDPHKPSERILVAHDVVMLLDAHTSARLQRPETVERVARAIYEADDNDDFPWEDEGDLMRDGYRELARAALAALEKP